MTRQRHAGIEDFGGELAHTFHAVVHIGDGLGHQLTGALFFQRSPALAHQIGIKDALHPPVDIVGKPPDIKTLHKPGRLHDKCDNHV